MDGCKIVVKFYSLSHSMLTFASFPFVKIERGIDSRDDKFERKLHFGEDVELISIPFRLSNLLLRVVVD